MSQSPLPPGWCWSTVGAVADVDGGLTRNASKRADSAERVPLVSVAAVRFRCIDTSEIGSISLLPSDGDRARLKRGDLLVVEGNGSKDQIGRVAIWDVDVPNARHQNHLIRVRPEGGVAPQLLLEWLASPGGRERLTRAATSVTGLYNLSLSKVEGIDLPLAPLSEQRRIVAKIEALTARSRTAREALQQVPPLLERFRQSVLAAAFRGDLTAEWRRQHPDVEPASVLLERIRAERRRRWEETELATMRAKGKTPANDKWKEKYDAPWPINPDGLPRLPEGWCWASLEEALTSLRNGIATKPEADSGLPILRISAVRPLSLDLNDVRYLAPDPSFSSYVLANGDLLFTRYNGNPRLVGVCGVVRGVLHPTVYPDKLIRGRCSPLVDGDYVAAAVNCGASRAFIDDKTKTAAGQVGISGSDLKLTPIPLAPEGEQAVIAHRIAEALTLTSSIAESVVARLGSLDRLDQSILAKAFRGELVPQDPNDEPASVLLDRIRAEREHAAGMEASSKSRAGKPPKRARKSAAAEPR